MVIGKSLIRLHLAALVVIAACVFTHRFSPARAAQTFQVLALPGGQPDDIAIDTRGRPVWGDLARGTVQRLEGTRIVTIARHLSLPEGIVVLPDGTIVVAEQGRDRIVRLSTRGTATVLYSLHPIPGQEGVDGIGRDPRSGNLLVPDSPNGTVLTMNPNGRNVHLLVHGLGRPVNAAVDTGGAVLIPDEHLGTLVAITSRGRVSYRGVFATPDDVAVTRSGRVWVTTLGDGGLWAIDPGAAPRRVFAGLASPQGLALDRCGDPIIVEQDTARIVRLLLTATSRRCRL